MVKFAEFGGGYSSKLGKLRGVRATFAGFVNSQLAIEAVSKISLDSYQNLLATLP